jgi:hypothetical protein
VHILVELIYDMLIGVCLIEDLHLYILPIKSMDWFLPFVVGDILFPFNGDVAPPVTEHGSNEYVFLSHITVFPQSDARKSDVACFTASC